MPKKTTASQHFPIPNMRFIWSVLLHVTKDISRLTYVYRRNRGRCFPPAASSLWWLRPHLRWCYTGPACTEEAVCVLEPEQQEDHPSQTPPEASWWPPSALLQTRSPADSPTACRRRVRWWRSRSPRATCWLIREEKFFGSWSWTEWSTARLAGLYMMLVKSSVNTRKGLLFRRKCKSTISECKANLMAVLTRCELDWWSCGEILRGNLSLSTVPCCK